MPINVPITILGASAKDFKPLPKDVYPFELIDLELVSEKGYQTEELVDKLKFEFACLDDSTLPDGTSLYGRRIWQRATLKLSGGKKPSTLNVLLSGILGRQFTKEELDHPEKFLSAEFLNTLIGKQVRLALGQKPKESDPSQINNTIDSYMPAKQPYPPFDKEKSKQLAEAAKHSQNGSVAEWKPEPEVPKL